MSSGSLAVLGATLEELEPAVASLTLAFASDPFARWVFPSSDRFLECFPEVARIHGMRSVDRGGVVRTSDGFGAAIWFPPGVAPDTDALQALFERSMSEAERSRVFAVFGEMDRFHPHGEHWYLRLIGVDPSVQGRGHGSALLRHTLARCDSEGLPAYLEATTERSAVLYERHGFEATGRIQIGESPTLWPMLRPARGRA